MKLVGFSYGLLEVKGLLGPSEAILREQSRFLHFLDRLFAS
jgi:hypothetical protein